MDKCNRRGGLFFGRDNRWRIAWRYGGSKRRQLVGQKVNVHHLYRKAEGVEEHVQRVGVPPIKTITP